MASRPPEGTEFVFAVLRLLANGSEDEVFQLTSRGVATGQTEHFFTDWSPPQALARIPLLARGLGLHDVAITTVAQRWREALAKGSCRGDELVELARWTSTEPQDDPLRRWQAVIGPRLRATVEAQNIEMVEGVRQAARDNPLFHAWPLRILESPEWRDLPSLFTIRPIALDDVWVELRLSMPGDDEAFTVSTSIFFEHLQRFSVVVGAPGSGKTTLLKWLARRIIICPGGRFVLPLFVALRSYARDAPAGTSLVDFALRSAGLRDSFQLELWQTTLAVLAGRRGENVLLLLDGLDEVPEGLRERVIEEIREASMVFATIVTSRPSGRPLALPADKVAEIADLRPQASRTLIRRWFAACEKPEKADQLIQWLETSPDLSRAASNPFVLSLLCATSEQSQGKAGLPRSRTEVYSRTFSALRGHHNTHMPPESRFTSDRLRSVARLARWLLDGAPGAPRYVFTANEVSLATGDPDLFDALLRPSRLVTLTYPDGDDYMFLHATLQEYLAAIDLTASKAELCACIRRHGHTPAWAGVLRFSAGLTDTPELWIPLSEMATHLDAAGLLAVRLAGCIAEADAQKQPGPSDGGNKRLGVDLRPALWEAILRGIEPQLFVDAYVELHRTNLLSRLEQGIREESQPLKAQLLRLRGRIRGFENTQSLVQLILAGNEQEAAIAAYQAEALDATGLATLRAAVNDPKAQRGRAIRALGLARDDGAITSIVSCSGVENLLPEVIQALQRIGGEASVQEILLLWKTTSPRWHTYLADALGSTRVPEARDFLLAQLARLDFDAPLAGTLLEALCEWPMREGSEVVLSFLTSRHSPSEHRLAAAWALTEANHPDISPGLRHAAVNDPELKVRVACLKALERAASPLDVAWLMTRVYDQEEEPSEEARAAALRSALRAIHLIGPGGQAAALNTMAWVLNNGSNTLAYTAAFDGHRAGPEAASLLLPLLISCNRSHAVREAACYSLGRLAWEDAAPELLTLIQAAPDTPREDEQILSTSPEARLARAAAWALSRAAPERLLECPGTTADRALAELAVETGTLVYVDRLIAPGTPWPFDSVKKETETDETDFDVALSFAGVDRPLASRLAEALRYRGLRVFIDKDAQQDLVARNLRMALHEVFTAAPVSVCIVSPAYLNSGYCRAEYEAVLEHDLKAPESLVVVRHGQVKPPGVSALRHMLDARQPVDELADSVVGVLKRLKSGS